MRVSWVVPVIVSIVILGTLGLSQDAFAAVDMFLKIEGIDGESKDAGHEDEIDVLAWSWGMSILVGDRSAGEPDIGKPTVQDLSITKIVDTATPKLMLSTLTGEIIPSAKLTLNSAGGEEKFEFLTIEMTDVFVSSVSIFGSTEEDKPTETITLNFATVTVTYTPRNADGSAGDKVIEGFDLRTGEKI